PASDMLRNSDLDSNLRSVSKNRAAPAEIEQVADDVEAYKFALSALPAFARDIDVEAVERFPNDVVKFHESSAGTWSPLKRRGHIPIQAPIPDVRPHFFKIQLLGSVSKQ